MQGYCCTLNDDSLCKQLPIWPKLKEALQEYQKLPEAFDEPGIHSCLVPRDEWLEKVGYKSLTAKVLSG